MICFVCRGCFDSEDGCWYDGPDLLDPEFVCEGCTPKFERDHPQAEPMEEA